MLDLETVYGIVIGVVATIIGVGLGYNLGRRERLLRKPGFMSCEGCRHHRSYHWKGNGGCSKTWCQCDTYMGPLSVEETMARTEQITARLAGHTTPGPRATKAPPAKESRYYS
jgi:hypothetical protein